MYSLFPVEPFAIVTFSTFAVSSVPVHPANVYPNFVGLFKLISLLSIVYVLGFSSANVPSFNS